MAIVVPGTGAKTGRIRDFLTLYESPEGLQPEFCTINPENRGNFSASY